MGRKKNSDILLDYFQEIPVEEKHPRNRPPSLRNKCMLLSITFVLLGGFISLYYAMDSLILLGLAVMLVGGIAPLGHYSTREQSMNVFQNFYGMRSPCIVVEYSKFFQMIQVVYQEKVSVNRMEGGREQSRLREYFFDQIISQENIFWVETYFCIVMN